MKGYESDYGRFSSKFQLYVTWVDHNQTIKDEQQRGVIEATSPQTGRNLHIGGFRLNGEGGGFVINVLVPQEVLGSFKMPQLGDIVWVEENRRNVNSTPIYVYSTYNAKDANQKYGSSPVPQWGSFPNDYGHLRSHRDHNRQFFPTVDSDFVTKYIKSITGYRFRHYYKTSLEEEKYAVRGDPVFDIEKPNINKEYMVSQGESLIQGSGVEQDKGKYPNPLNSPSKREESDKYSYVEMVNRVIDTELDNNKYNHSAATSKIKPEFVDFKLKNKNYVSYQPVVDKEYLDKAKFEREIPAAEEYVVALRGNNKLLIQDQHGDGEQLLITLKNQYDAGFTIVHNKEKSQIRIRDHLGQGVLLEADPDAPRVMMWTANRQIIEQGSVKDKGSYSYVRNGVAYGKPDTSYGTDTGVEKEEVANQEFLLVSSPEIVGELGSRLSSVMKGWAEAEGGVGMYVSNFVTPENKQLFGLYEKDEKLVTHERTALENGSFVDFKTESEAGLIKTIQTYNHLPVLGNIEYTREVSDDYAKTTETLTNNSGDVISSRSETGFGSENRVIIQGLLINEVLANIGELSLKRYADGSPAVDMVLTPGSVDVYRYIPMPINVGADGQSGAITIGNSLGPTTIAGSDVSVSGASSIELASAAINMTNT